MHNLCHVFQRDNELYWAHLLSRCGNIYKKYVKLNPLRLKSPRTAHDGIFKDKKDIWN